MNWQQGMNEWEDSSLSPTFITCGTGKVTELEREGTNLREKLQEKCLGHVKLEMPTRYLSEDTEEAIMSF